MAQNVPDEENYLFYATSSEREALGYGVYVGRNRFHEAERGNLTCFDAKGERSISWA